MSPSCILCERTGAWAISLRLAGGSHRLPWRETRNLDDAWLELGANPRSVLVVEVTRSNLQRLVGLLTRLRLDFPSAVAVVVGERAMEPATPVVLEAGAHGAIFSPRAAPGLARLVRTHLATVPIEATGSLRQLLWLRLPWSTA